MIVPKDNLGPYLTQNDPSHPGVKGEAYHHGPLGGVDRIDVPGTGTFPPHQQGVVNKAQPQGLSSTNHYGYAGVTDDQKLKLSQMASPLTVPPGTVPDDHIEQLKNRQPVVAGLNAPLPEFKDENDGEVQEDEEDDDSSIS
jgi:hypothetical protein